MFKDLLPYIRLGNGRFNGSLNITAMRSELMRGYAAGAVMLFSIGYAVINAIIVRSSI